MLRFDQMNDQPHPTRHTKESGTSKRARTGKGKPFSYSYRVRGQQFPVHKYHITDTNGDTLEDMRKAKPPD